MDLVQCRLMWCIVEALCFEAEKQQYQANWLSIYCDDQGHTTIYCPHQPKREVHEISNIQNFNSCSLIKHNKARTSVSGPQSNSFDVLSQLDDLLNK